MSSPVTFANGNDQPLAAYARSGVSESPPFLSSTVRVLDLERLPCVALTAHRQDHVRGEMDRAGGVRVPLHQKVNGCKCFGLRPTGAGAREAEAARGLVLHAQEFKHGKEPAAGGGVEARKLCMSHIRVFYLSP